VYNTQDILSVKISLLQRTNLVDFEISEYQKLHNTTDKPAGRAHSRKFGSSWWC